MDFEPEQPDMGERPDDRADDGTPESIRSLMFHSNDDLPWAAGDLDALDRPDEAADDATGSAVPIEPDAPAPPGPGDSRSGSRMDARTDDEPAASGSPVRPRTPSGPAAPSGWSDTITSTDGPHYWDRLMSSERDRIRRYRRPATVVFLEVAHLEELARTWGDDVAAQSLVRIGRTVMRQIRSSDHCARIGVGRFAFFLPETDEIAAINFVERIRGSVEQALGLMADTIRIGIGWASPTDGNLDAAVAVAEGRLAADLAANA